jgi:regulator of ribonuclease activity A
MSHRAARILAHLTPVPVAASITAAAAGAVPAPVAPAPALIATADLCDDHASVVSLLPFQFTNYGGLRGCHGPVLTLKVHEDNGLVRATLETPGEGRVLLVDGGASLRCAIVGDQLGSLCQKNGWGGIIVVGAVRDVAALASMPICVQALGTNPHKSVRRGGGARDVGINVGSGAFGVIHTGDYLYADEDGVIVSKNKLH